MATIEEEEEEEKMVFGGKKERKKEARRSDSRKEGRKGSLLLYYSILFSSFLVHFETKVVTEDGLCLPLPLASALHYFALSLGRNRLQIASEMAKHDPCCHLFTT